MDRLLCLKSLGIVTQSACYLRLGIMSRNLLVKSYYWRRVKIKYERNQCLDTTCKTGIGRTTMLEVDGSWRPVLRRCLAG
jgi:hypothetical protein